MASLLIHEDEQGFVEIIGYADDILTRFPERYRGRAIYSVEATEMDNGAGKLPGSGFRLTLCPKVKR